MATATRGYIAISMSFDARTDKVEITARQDLVITGTNGASVSIKAGEKFTVVRAASLGENMWYIVRDVVGQKKCTCMSHKPCKHEIAVFTGRPLAELQAEVEARKVAKSRKSKVSQAVAAKVAEAEKIVATGAYSQNAVAVKVLRDVEQTTVKEKSSDKMLNAALTKNQGFCIMR